MEILRNLLGNLSSGLIRLLVTVGIIAAVGYFLVRPALETTKDISREANESIRRGFNQGYGKNGFKICAANIYEGIYALPSDMVRSGPHRLTSWPICSLPAAPESIDAAALSSPSAMSEATPATSPSKSMEPALICSWTPCEATA